MQAEAQEWSHHSHHGCHEGQQSRGPAWFYGYCHESGRMRMMDYPDYVQNVQTGFSNFFGGMASTYQPYIDVLQGRAGGGHRYHDKSCGCCGGHHREEHDCHCSCCIRCADAVEFVRCGDLRRIPITLDNDTRRERDVRLELGAFATESGKELGWHAALSETQFKLAPCAERTILLTVSVDCSKFGTAPPASGDRQPEAPATVDRCQVAYATLRAEGCLVRPLVIAVAVLPNDCGAYRAGCLCGCCCC
jgi:hypothetical protein